MGKLRNEELAAMLRCIKKTSKVLVPPLPGFDSGVHVIDSGRLLVISTDPCIGVPEKWFGWLLINYAASDVALFGAKPQYCSINLLGPPGTEPQEYQRVMKQICGAADEQDLIIITGHTGSYNGLTTMLGVSTAYGIIEKKDLVTPAGAKPGDVLLCIKPFGLETAVNFSMTHEHAAKEIFGKSRAIELRQLVTMQSCVKEALLLAKTGAVHAMHDATEGGLIAALNEMAEASKVGFRIDYEKIPVCKEARTLGKRFKLSDEQLLSMSSTGTFLASVNPENKEKVDLTLRRHNIQAAVLGVFTEGKERVLLKGGKQVSFPRDADDPYARILSGRP